MAVHHNDSLQGLVLITSNTRIWSGGPKLTREEDLSEVKDRLPPSAMVTDGRKNLVKPSALAPFHAIRKRLERLLRSEGYPLMSDAFAVPVTELDRILKKIDELESEFNAEIPVFLDALPQHYQAQIDEFPDWADQLRSGQLTRTQIASRLQFSVGVFKMAPPDADDAGSSRNRQYTNIVNGAVPALLNDLADKAQQLLKGPIGQRLCVTQTQHAQVRRLVEKLDAFGFLDHRVGPTAAALDDMLSVIPATGPLSAGNTAVLRVVIQQLADPDTLLQQYTADEGDDDSAPAPAAVAPVVSAPAAPPPPAFVGI